MSLANMQYGATYQAGRWKQAGQWDSSFAASTADAASPAGRSKQCKLKRVPRRFLHLIITFSLSQGPYLRVWNAILVLQGVGLHRERSALSKLQ